jgi:hypothetical protein
MAEIRTPKVWPMTDIGLGYSDRKLAADLRTWWDDQVDAEDDPFADPQPPRTGTIFEVVPAVDSLGVVTALITIEKHVGFTVPPRIIQRGGYNSCDDMLNDLLPKIRALVLRKRKEAA